MVTSNYSTRPVIPVSPVTQNFIMKHDFLKVGRGHFQHSLQPRSLPRHHWEGQE